MGPGFWGSMGAAVAEPCPVDADGDPIDAFYCPGWEEDIEFRGSKPLLVPTGQRLVSATAEEVSATATYVEGAYDEQRAKEEFAASVGVTAEEVVATAVPSERMVVQTSFTLEQEADTFNATAFRLELA